MIDVVTVFFGMSAVANVGLLTGIFFRLGSLTARITSIEKRQENPTT
jgi:hypothetical protein